MSSCFKKNKNETEVGGRVSSLKVPFPPNRAHWTKDRADRTAQ